MDEMNQRACQSWDELIVIFIIIYYIIITIIIIRK